MINPLIDTDFAVEHVFTNMNMLIFVPHYLDLVRLLAQLSPLVLDMLRVQQLGYQIEREKMLWNRGIDTFVNARTPSL